MIKDMERDKEDLISEIVLLRRQLDFGRICFERLARRTRPFFTENNRTLNLTSYCFDAIDKNTILKAGFKIKEKHEKRENFGELYILTDLPDLEEKLQFSDHEDRCNLTPAAWFKKFIKGKPSPHKRSSFMLKQVVWKGEFNIAKTKEEIQKVYASPGIVTCMTYENIDPELFEFYELYSEGCAYIKDGVGRVLARCILWNIDGEIYADRINGDKNYLKEMLFDLTCAKRRLSKGVQMKVPGFKSLTKLPYLDSFSIFYPESEVIEVFSDKYTEDEDREVMDNIPSNSEEIFNNAKGAKLQEVDDYEIYFTHIGELSIEEYDKLTIAARGEKNPDSIIEERTLLFAGEFTIEKFIDRFYRILNRIEKNYPSGVPIGAKSQLTYTLTHKREKRWIQADKDYTVTSNVGLDIYEDYDDPFYYNNQLLKEE